MRPSPIAIALAVTLASAPATAADRDHPTVVELFQSQGCSSCPPANAVLATIADRPDILALNFAVTYWDKLGWKDSFAQPAFTARQWDYARRGGRGNVATPQVVVNGRGVVTGNRREIVDATLAKFDRGTGGPSLQASPGAISVGAGRGSAIVWLVRYDPRSIAVPIRAGENDGKTLPHRNIVRQLVRIGTWSGRAARYVVPAGPARLASAVLLQAGPGGAIVASRRL